MTKNSIVRRLEKIEDKLSIDDEKPRFTGVQYMIVKMDGTKVKGPYKKIEP